MNKRILLGFFALTLGAINIQSLWASKETKSSLSSHSWQSPPKREPASTATPQLIGSSSRENVSQTDSRSRREELLKQATQTAREMQKVADNLTKASEEKSTRRPAPTRSRDGEKTVFTESLQSSAIDITKPTTVTTASGQTKGLQPGTVYFSEPLDPAAITTKADKKTKKTDSPAEVETGKTTREKREGSSLERTKIERIYTEENKIIAIPAAPPLPTELKDKKGKFGMYAPTEAELVEKKGQLKPIATTPDESKPGMSGKKKAALGAGAAAGVGAAALGAGLIGAGLIGAGVLATSGDKDQPAPEIAPERVEDIKGLDAGSGLDQSFEPSPISN